jgi:hypothetical protein
VACADVGLRVDPDIEEALDAWIAQQPDQKPSKPEAFSESCERHCALTDQAA